MSPASHTLSPSDTLSLNFLCQMYRYILIICLLLSSVLGLSFSHLIIVIFVSSRGHSYTFYYNCFKYFSTCFSSAMSIMITFRAEAYSSQSSCVDRYSLACIYIIILFQFEYFCFLFLSFLDLPNERVQPHYR